MFWAFGISWPPRGSYSYRWPMAIYSPNIELASSSLSHRRRDLCVGNSKSNPYSMAIFRANSRVSACFGSCNRLCDILERFAQTMVGIQGAIIVTSAFQMIIGFSGMWRIILRILCPLSAVPLVSFTGLGLYYLAFPVLAKCIAVGLPELFIMIFISQYLPTYVKSKRPVCDRFAVLASVSIVWIYAGILTWSDGPHKKNTDALTSCRTDRAGLVNGSPWFNIPYPFQWGPPTFTIGEAFVMMVSSFVASIEGIGTLLHGFLGCVTGSTASVENAGLLALTRVGSRRVAHISDGFMIIFSVVGNNVSPSCLASAASIPMPIIAALYCILFGYVCKQKPMQKGRGQEMQKGRNRTSGLTRRLMAVATGSGQVGVQVDHQLRFRKPAVG